MYKLGKRRRALMTLIYNTIGRIRADDARVDAYNLKHPENPQMPFQAADSFETAALQVLEDRSIALLNNE